MAKDTIQQALDKQAKIMEDLKPYALRSALGAWAVHCFDNGIALNAQTLKEWNEQVERTKADKLVIDELLDKLEHK